MSNQSVMVGTRKKTYFCDFSKEETTMSDGGAWRPRINTNLTDFQTTGGKAIGKATGTSGAGYDDSAALLTGFSQDVQITATVFVGTSIAATTHEAELLFRSTQTSSLSDQIEALFNYQGGCQCFHWEDGGGGSQTFTGLTPVTGGESLGRPLVTGDRIRAKIQGSTITLQVIDASDVVTTLATYTDPGTSGQPGIGAFTRQDEGGNLTKFNFLDVYVEDL